jgi:hypothetical protein
MHHTSKFGWLVSHKAALAALILVAILLVIDHWNHIVTALPYLLLLACPLMHLFMHGGHGGHGHQHSEHCDHKHDKKPE